MHPERLLERIRSTEGTTPQRGSDNQRRGQSSVLSHLQRMLNTHRGNVQIAGDYGVPDFLDFLQSYPESVHLIEQDIRTAIDKFEPRLCQVRVTHIPDAEETLTLRFQIAACLSEVDGFPHSEQRRFGRQVFFETLISANGRVHLHR